MLYSQPESTLNSLFLVSPLPHGFRYNPGSAREPHTKASRLEHKTATFDGNMPGLHDAMI